MKMVNQCVGLHLCYIYFLIERVRVVSGGSIEIKASQVPHDKKTKSSTSGLNDA